MPARDHCAAITRRGWLGEAGAVAAAAVLSPRLGWAAPGIEARFPNVAAMIESCVADRKLAGMLAALGWGRAAPGMIARGREGFGDGDPVGLDSLFRIYSMTKPITGMAAMILIDEGRLGLDQPLAELLPGFARMQVLAAPDGSLTELRPARTAITVRHLLTHTAGLGYSIVQKGPLRAAFEGAGVIAGQVSRIPIPGFGRGKPALSLASFADRLAGLPLVYEPGTRWSYSAGLDLMGRVIEVASGQPFDAFLADRLFAPLGMTSTFFQVPPGELHRLTTNYGILAGMPLPIDPPERSIFADPPPFPLGGAGLVSSPRDYDRFLEMLVNYGTLDGRRVMSAAAVRLGTGNLLPAGVITRGTLAEGAGFGAGGRIGLGEQAGTYGWGGAAGTVALVHLGRGLRAALFTQYMPSDAYPVHRDFPLAVAADLRALAAA